MIDRQTLGNLVPLAAVVIALVATVGLLVMVQVLRFTAARRRPAGKPDYSATTLIRKRGDPEDRG